MCRPAPENLGRSRTHRGFCNDRFLRGYKRTFRPFHRGIVTAYALEVGAAGEGNNWDHSFSAFCAVRYPIHEILPIFFTHNRRQSSRALPGARQLSICDFPAGPRDNRAAPLIGGKRAPINIAPEWEAVPAAFSRGRGLFHFSQTEPRA
jgi:hypothetical protein